MLSIKRYVLGLLAVALSFFGLSAHAAPPDMTALVAAVDFSTVTTAILAVAAVMIVVYIAWKGAKMVIVAVRGA